MDGIFELTKMRLLLHRLDAEANPALHLRIIREAENAAAEAARTGYASLVFPCLFEERAQVAVKRQIEQSSSYWGDLAGAPRCNLIVTKPTPARHERP